MQDSVLAARCGENIFDKCYSRHSDRVFCIISLKAVLWRTDPFRAPIASSGMRITSFPILMSLCSFIFLSPLVNDIISFSEMHVSLFLWFYVSILLYGCYVLNSDHVIDHIIWNFVLGLEFEIWIREFGGNSDFLLCLRIMH